jgi:hypothetical protein
MLDTLDSDRINKTQQLRIDAIHELEELLAMKLEEITILEQQLTCLRRFFVTNFEVVDPYGDHGIYTGQMDSNSHKPHGNGIMNYEDGRIYNGDWCDGRWHGYGIATFSNGDTYEGNYNYDQRHGIGTYRWSDGRVYSGTFQADKRHGKG